MIISQQVVESAAGKFDNAAWAILKRCEQSGVQIRVVDGHLKAKGNSESISAWYSMIQRHKSEIIAALTGTESNVDFMDTLRSDSEELTACIIELCHLAGYSDDARDRMLAVRRNLYPFQIATEAAYFRLQVECAKTGKYPSIQPHNLRDMSLKGNAA